MTTAASEAANVTYRQLDHWVRAGYLHPQSAGGSGNWRSWPPGELEVAECMGKLTRAGLTPAAAHRVARAGRASMVLAAMAGVM